MGTPLTCTCAQAPGCESEHLSCPKQYSWNGSRVRYCGQHPGEAGMHYGSAVTVMGVCTVHICILHKLVTVSTSSWPSGHSCPISICNWLNRSHWQVPELTGVFAVLAPPPSSTQYSTSRTMHRHVKTHAILSVSVLSLRLFADSPLTILPA